MLKFLVCFPLGPYTYVPLALTPYTIEAFQFKIPAPIIFSPERLFSSQILFVSLFVGNSIYPLLGNVNDTSYLTSLYFNDLPYYMQAPFSLKNTIVFSKAALPRATFSAGFSNIYFFLFLCD